MKKENTQQKYIIDQQDCNKINNLNQNTVQNNDKYLKLEIKDL